VRFARALARAAALASVAATLALARAAVAAPLDSDEIGKLCANAEGTAHCGRLVEGVQLTRLPNLATREGAALKVKLYPIGVATFADTESIHGPRSYSLWDYLDPINAVLLYTTDADTVTFTLLQRANGRTVELPTEPKVSPDRQRLVTADFCPKQCVNELALWRVTRDGVTKEAAWKPAERWEDAGAHWKNPDTVVVEYTLAGSGQAGTLERRVNDPSWRRVAAP
jgi:hypothetical protein